METLDQAQLANKTRAAILAGEIAVVHISVRYDFTTTRWEDMIGQTALVPTDNANMARAAAFKALCDAGEHAREVRWNLDGSLQGHYIGIWEVEG